MQRRLLTVLPAQLMLLLMLLFGLMSSAQPPLTLRLQPMLLITELLRVPLLLLLLLSLHLLLLTLPLLAN
jgi:hypothetical protein